MKASEREKRRAEFLDKRRHHATRRIEKAVQPSIARKRLNEPCSCNSGKPFKACCYRPDHSRYDLKNYLETYKHSLEKLREAAQLRIISEYKRGDAVITTAADNIAHKMSVTTIQDFQAHDTSTIEYFKANADVPPRVALPRALLFQELALDHVLPGHQKPLFEEFTRALIRRASTTPLVKEAQKALLAGSHAIFEVIKVRRGQGRFPPQWVLFKNIFDGSLHEFKDPDFKTRYNLWDMVFGRMIVLNGFPTFDLVSIQVLPFKRPCINRILLYLFLQNEIKDHGLTEAELEVRFSTLFLSFPMINDPLDHAGLCSPEIAAFVKDNGSILHVIYSIQWDDEFLEIDDEEIEEASDFIAKQRDARIGFATLNDLPVTTFHDALLAENAQLATVDLDEPRHFMEVSLVGRIPASRATPIPPAQGATENKILPDLSILLNFPLERYVNVIEEACSEACKGIYKEYRDVDNPILAPIDRKCTNSIILDEKDAITMNAQDDAHFQYLNELCNAALARLGRDAITWKKIMSGKEFMDFAKEATRQGTKGGADTFNERQWLDEVDEDDYDNDDVDIDDDEDVDYSYPPAFIASRMRRWCDTPKAVLLGNTPRECVGDERLEPSLIMLVKQIESLETGLLQEHERQSYWKLLGLRKP